jgi:hypothetical protein
MREAMSRAASWLFKELLKTPPEPLYGTEGRCDAFPVYKAGLPP